MVFWCYHGSMKSALVGLLTAQELRNTASQSVTLVFLFEGCLSNILAAHDQSHFYKIGFLIPDYRQKDQDPNRSYFWKKSCSISDAIYCSFKAKYYIEGQHGERLGKVKTSGLEDTYFKTQDQAYHLLESPHPLSTNQVLNKNLPPVAYRYVIVYF